MSTIQVEPQPKPLERESQEGVVNDFSIQVATVNGSGSQSSNNVLMRAIFQMGVPISGKNLFPSNIAGLPTWFTIRASKDGYLGRKREIDILVAMNAETAREDVESLHAGRVVVYEERLNLSRLRGDLVYYPIPFAKLASEVVQETRMRKLIANMIYVGSVAELLGIEMREVERAIEKWFKTKKRAIDLNIRAAQMGAAYVGEKIAKKDPYRVERMNKTQGKIIIEGNSACALGSLFAGVTVVTWYPITPSSSLCEMLADYMKRFRLDSETGKATFAIVQAEDELAALGMALGAGWAGARAMTSTSGPGISLMAEFAGLGYFAEVPCVIFDIQRIGPSTGLPTRTSQGDILSLYYLSHGDTRHIVLFPGSMKECFELSMQAYDLAERLQQPVFVASDLDLGMNNWMAEPFDHPQKLLDRGKVLSKKELEKLGEFARYRDVDGDGIPYRTLPATEHPLAAHLTRGSGHDEKAEYTENPGRLQESHGPFGKEARDRPKMGSSTCSRVHGRCPGGSDCLRLHKRCYGGVSRSASHRIWYRTHYFRIRALPLTEELKDFVNGCERVYVVEQNPDGQMEKLVRLELGTEAAGIRKVLHYSGWPIDARFITDRMVASEQGERK